MPRSIDGHGSVRTPGPRRRRIGFAVVVHDLRSRRLAAGPGGAGLRSVTPGSGVIMIAPVSVCHHVSTTGTAAADWRRYQIQASGLIGSPTEPSSRSDDRSYSCRTRLAELHERPDGGGRGVEDRHLVLLDDLPPAARCGVRRALVDHLRRAVGERPVDHVGVAGDPADVGGAPVDVALGVEVEDVLVGVRGLRSGTRRWCAGCPSASRWCPRCRG